MQMWRKFSKERNEYLFNPMTVFTSDGEDVVSFVTAETNLQFQKKGSLYYRSDFISYIPLIVSPSVIRDYSAKEKTNVKFCRKR